MNDEETVRKFISGESQPYVGERTEAFCALTRLIAAKEQAEKERDSFRRTLDERWEADKKAFAAIMRAAGRTHGVPPNKEVVAYFVEQNDALTARLRSMCEALQGAEWVLSQSETYTIGLMVTCRMTQKQIHNSDVLANIRKAASTIRAELAAAKKELAQPAHPENRPCP